MLPIMTKPEDALIVATYLNTKVTGATLQDAKATLEGRVLDPRKISAYETWGLVTKEAEVLRLTSRGRQLARALDDDRHRVFTEIILELHAYRIAAEWLHHGTMDVVTRTELATHWFDHIPGDLGTTAEKTIRDQAICFLELAEAAGLGTYFVGRRGRPTRLEINRDALAQLVARAEQSAGASNLDASGTSTEVEEEGAASDTEIQSEEQYPTGVESDEEPGMVLPQTTRVFISHGPNVDIVDQIKTMLDLGDLQYEVVVEQESTAIPVPQKVFDAMRRCDAAVMCVTADSDAEREDGSYEINPNVLIEIGAAFVLYDKRVALVWDRRIPVPSNLQGIYRCEFEGNELSWLAGMKLMKTVKEFKGLK